MKTRGDILVRDYLEDLRADPVLAAKEILGIDLAPHQRVAIRGVFSHPWSMHVWGRGTGKTTVLNAVAAALLAVLFPGEKIIIVGPGFRQAQFVFRAIEEFADTSPVFRECIVGNGRGVKHNTSEWRMDFKNKSFIVAVPLGNDGSKVRGYRANTLIIDELVQVPEEIINRVLIPFMSTNKNPMAQYMGLVEEAQENRLIYTTSAFYTFNHAYRRFSTFLEEIYRYKSPDYFVSQFNYHHTPKGFANMKVIETARKQSTEADFRTEWLAEWVSDTAGFYPASLLAQCQSVNIQPELRGVSEAEYVLGVDPASVYNTCGFVVVKIGEPYRLVHVASLDNQTYPDMCLRILEYMSKYNIVRIGLDRGAGIPIFNLFEEGRPFVNESGVMEKVRLLDIESDSTDGRKIIQGMATHPQGITEMNYIMKAAMESENIKWGVFAGDGEGEVLMEKERAVEQIREMETEFRMVDAVQNRTGYFSFSVPAHRNKDRYSAALFAFNAAKTYVEEGRNAKQLVLPSGFWGGRSSRRL